MPWVRIHDAAMTHPKVIGLSDKAFRLWVWGLSYAQTHLTDGFIPTEAVSRSRAVAIVSLVERGLWARVEKGWQIHDYLDWNDSRETVTAKREGAKARLAQHREKRVTSSTSETPLKRVSSLTSETPLARSGVVNSTRSSEKEPDGEDPIAERAGRLLQELYPAWYAQYRNGARLRLVANTLAFNDAMSVVQLWDDARIEKLARIVLTTDDPFIANTDRSFRIFAMKASWADDRLRQAESGAA